MQLLEVSDRQAWDSFVSGHAYGHPLQLWGWGEAKRGNGWSAHRLALVDGDTWLGGAEILMWQIPRIGRFVAYVPRGPVVEPGSEVASRLFAELAAWARAHRALYVRVEPAWVRGAPSKGWVKARHHLQLAETYTIDLRQSEDELLEPMARKHRQYIRKAERDGVTVERVLGEDLGAMYELYGATAARAGFGIHSADHYRKLHRELGEHSWLYYAQSQGRPVAFLWLAEAGETAYELYGGVSDEGQELKANYFLKWRVMLDMKQLGRVKYDFNGRLNEGVSRFKDGFGPAATDYIGTWDYPIGRVGYRLWEHLWPLAKVVGRRMAKLRRER